jgi:hypothetical protein
MAQMKVNYLNLLIKVKGNSYFERTLYSKISILLIYFRNKIGLERLLNPKNLYNRLQSYKVKPKLKFN